MCLEARNIRMLRARNYDNQFKLLCIVEENRQTFSSDTHSSRDY